MIAFDRVFFGFADAETEAERNPTAFQKSFYDPHEYMKELINGHKYILRGRMVIGQAIRGLFGLETAWTSTWERMPMMIEYINVFFIAGISYLLLALLRQIRIPAWAYFVLALAFIFINPYLYMDGKSTGVAALDYLLTMFTGGRPAVSLCCLAHMPYVLLGVGFGRVLRRTSDKDRLYKIIAVPAAVILIAYFIYAITCLHGHQKNHFPQACQAADKAYHN